VSREPALIVESLDKSFTLHNAGGTEIPVFRGLNLEVRPGECVALAGASGVGKSTLMRAIYANYRVSGGRVLVRHDGALVNMISAAPNQIMDIRRRTLGYVSQFLRVIPRVPTIDIVAQPLLENGVAPAAAAARARALLARLNLPQALWSLPPATFSGGEQQRVNVAVGFAQRRPLLLLDEPTASLDAVNRDVVLDMIKEALDDGAAIVGIFHDAHVRDAVAKRDFEVADFAAAA